MRASWRYGAPARQDVRDGSQRVVHCDVCGEQAGEAPVGGYPAHDDQAVAGFVDVGDAETHLG
ncbi:hypothetical protein GCM10022214_38540 [Actinomadura miaoliensis]|uniref:Uncharacterized protein n=1 Tax=Actinomadura miaoliensis TaxID=430685 RepID=A0ABP7VZB6_9ACTN